MSRRTVTLPPIFLYVSAGGVSEITLDRLGVEVERVIDVEVNKQDAKKLLDMLNKAIEQDLPGTIAFRLTGKLVV